MKKKEINQLELLANRAEQALRDAVAEVIENHRLTGRPLAVMKDGKAVFLPPDQVNAPALREEAGIYRTGSKRKKGRPGN